MVTRRPQVTLMQLTYFVEAARLSSMSAASDELRIAQSAISAAIAHLESVLGTQLFLRQRARGLVLTAAGQQFLADATAILGDVDGALESARDAGSEVRGVIRLGCFVTLAPFVIPALLSLLGERYPHLLVDVVEGDAAAIRRDLRDGTTEVALAYGFAVEGGMTATVMSTARPYALFPAGHRLAQQPTVRLRDLGTERLVLLDLPTSRDYFLDLLGSVGIEPYIRYRGTSYETVRSLVARGHGYALLNQRTLTDETYDGGRVTAVELADEIDPLPIVLMRMETMRQTARARAVAECLRDAYAGIG